MTGPAPHSQTVCPGDEQIAEFVAGRLSLEATDRLAEHVDVCEACQAKVAALDNAEAPSTDRLAKGGRELPYADEQECLEALVRIQRGGSPAPAATLASEATAGHSALTYGGTSPDPPAHLERVGEYQLLEPLGAGGMGTVYKARHVGLGSLYAVKLLHPRRSADRQAIERFQREMVALGQLDHPHIVRAIDAGEEGGIHYLVMEYVEGVDLSRLAAQHGVLPVPEACELIRQAALGLAYAHRQGRVHRDIKPSNLMLAGLRVSDYGPRIEEEENLQPAARNPQSAIVKLLDLGLARFGEMSALDEPSAQDLDTLLDYASDSKNLTLTNQVMGTLEYMAPEQASDSRAVDPRSDIYSLGCTLYKLLAGRAPFGERRYSTSAKQMLAHAQAPVPPIRQIRPETPPGLAALLERMLAKKPEDRPASAEDVAAALAPFAAGADLPRLLAGAETAESEETTDHAAPTVTLAQVVHRPVPAPTQAAPLNAARIPWLPIVLTAGVAFFVLGVTLMVLLLKMSSARGTVVLEFDTPEAELTLQQAGLIDQYGNRQAIYPDEQTLRIGAYFFDPASSGLTFSPNEFELRRNDRQVIRVALAPVIPAWDESGPITSQFPPVDLLALVDLDRDATKTAWRRDGVALVSENDKMARLQFPYQPPHEYRVEAVVERLGRTESLHLGLPLGDRRFRVILDGWPNDGYLSGPTNLDGQEVPAYKAQAYRGIVIPASGPVHLAWTVRRQDGQASIRVERGDGRQWQEIFTWRGQESRLSESGGEAPPTANVLYLFTWHNPLKISQLRVIPISGEGRLVEFADPAANPDLAAAQRLVWKAGRVWVRDGAALREVTQRADLPAQPVVEQIDATTSQWLTSADLPYFAHLQNLRRLEFSGPALMAEDLARLTGLPRLETLRLGGADLAGDATTALRDLPQLRHLDLRGARLDDAALAAIGNLAALEELDLAYTGVTDKNLPPLAQLSRLTRLNLDHTGVTDAGLPALATLPALARLSLMATGVTDAGAAELAAAPSLKEVNLIGAQLTHEGAKQLRAKLPNATPLTGYEGPIDLLPDVDLNWSEAVKGPWSFSDGALAVSSPSGVALAPVTVSLPAEYDLEVTARRTGGQDAFALVLHGGGRQFLVQFDQAPTSGPYSLVDMIDGTREQANETAKKIVWFPGGESVQTTVQVRSDSVRVLRNGEPVIAWNADYQRVWLRDDWRLADPRVWGVGAHSSSFVITQLSLRPISGAAGAIPVRPAPHTSERDLAERILELGGTVFVTFDGHTETDWPATEPLPDRPLWVRRAWNLKNVSLTAEDLARFGQTQQLRALYLDGAIFEERHLAALAGHRSLLDLWLRTTGITDAGLAQLGRIPQLEKTSVTGSARANAQVTDAGLAQLASLNLTDLGLVGAAITDEGLKTIGQMKRLRWLEISNTQATGAGLAHLQGLPDLRYLQANGLSGLGAEPMASLANLPLLQSLSLNRSDFGDAAAARLAESPFRNLRQLRLEDTQLTDEGARHLARLTHLNHLELSRTQLTDAGVSALAALRDLEVLKLDGCGVTDAALASLSRLRKLRELHLNATRFTPQGAARMRSELPACQVHAPLSDFDLAGGDEPPLPAPAGPAVDLLASIDLERDAPPGQWRQDGAALTVALNAPAWLQIPYVPPSDYVLRATVERLPGQGQEGPNLGLVVGGRQVRLALDNWPHEGFLSGPHLLENRGLETHKDQAFRGQAIPNGRPVEITCAVLHRNGLASIQVEAAGRKLFTWRGDPIHLSMDPTQRPPRTDVLFLFCSDAPIRFSRLEVTPLATGGRVVEFADPAQQPALAAAQRAIWKGGTVETRQDNQTVVVEQLADLPAEPTIIGIDGRTSPWFAAADLPYFSHLPELERLNLAGATIDGAGLPRLTDLPKLAELNLAGAVVGSASVANLHAFPQLRRLNLSSAPLEDAALAPLAELRQLTDLDLSATPVTDAGLAELAKLDQLARLDLSRTAVTGAEAAVLSKVAALAELSLNGAAVTDAAIEPLAQLTGLKRLGLIATQVTEQGAAALRQRLPQARIASDFDEAIDLLSLVDWNVGVVRGEWRRADDALVISPRQPGVMMLPVAPPEEYDVELVAKRTAGQDGVGLMLVGGGRQFLVEFDQFPHSGPFTLIDWIEGARGGQNETHVRLNAFPLNEEVRVTVEVRRDRVRVHRNGQQLIDWPAAYGRVSVMGVWRNPYPRALGLVAWNSGVEFRTLTLRPVSGRLELLRLEPTPATSERGLALWARERGAVVNVSFDGQTQQAFLPEENLPDRPLWVRRIAMMHAPELSSEDFARLAKAEQLQVLDLSTSRFEEADLATLAGQPSLTVLLLNNTALTDAGLAHVARIASLERLHLRGAAVTNDGVAQLVGLSRLLELRLEATAVTEEVLPRLAPLSRLEWLALDDAPVTDDGLAHLQALPNLKVLHLNGTAVTDAGLARLASHRAVRSIRVGRTRVTGAGFAALEDLPLTVIQLGTAKVDEEGFAQVARFRTLRSLDVAGARITDDALAVLAQMRDLDFLHLGWTQVRGPGLAHLERLPSLRELLLTRSLIDDAGLEHVGKLRALRRLDLDHTAVTDAGLQHLAGLTLLEELNLTATKVTEEGAQTLRNTLPHCKIKVGEEKQAEGQGSKEEE